MYRLYEFPKEELDEKSLKILRLGTIIHKDFEKAFLYHIEQKKNQGTIYTEHKVNIESLNITGTLDAGEYIESGKARTYNLYDLKSSAAYKWSTMFGFKKNRQPTFEYDKYRMQLATYAMAVKEEHDINAINMFLVFYNKNTSMMRVMGKDFEEKLRPGFQFGVPFEDWECSYCSYEAICPSNIKNKK
mgnify:CR=1 FL=1